MAEFSAPFLAFPLPRRERLGQGELRVGLKTCTYILVQRKVRVNEALNMDITG